MVVKGRGGFKKPEKPSPTSRIGKIASLQRMPDKDKALEILHELAEAVSPIMEKNNYKVALLCEMHPKDPHLLGLNVNRGQKVLVRLRSASNVNQFLPFGDLLGTVLHELVHNRLGPHNKAFYDCLDDLKNQYAETSMRSALQRSGFVSVGDRVAKPQKKVGSSRTFSESRKLGGAKVRKPLATLVREAAERRARDARWCGDSSVNIEDETMDVQIVRIVKKKMKLCETEIKKEKEVVEDDPIVVLSTETIDDKEKPNVIDLTLD